MDCQEAQEHILESLAQDQSDANTRDLENYLVDCATCRSFSGMQRRLDLELSIAFSAPSLSSAFRASLLKK